MTEIKINLQKYFDIGDTDNALKYLLELVNSTNISKTDRAEVYNLIGRIYFYEHNLDEAKLYFIESLKNSERNVYSRLYLGIIAEKQQKYESALRIYSSCNKTNPELKELKERITKVALNLQPENKEINDLLSLAENNTEKENHFPLVSIIILCYNKLEYTQKCLSSVFKNTKYENFEVIVVDNGSIDDTPAFLETWGDKIKFIHSNKNLGFVGGNNFAAQNAKGKYLVFLNNDTEVIENWLVQLYNTFVIHPDAGAVGSMLIYPDNKLQEAGGIIFNDGTGWNYGRNGTIHDSRINFLREVDYCSGAALMVRNDLFQRNGMFDTHYSPAYYEDTDLCFGIRKLGYKVYYCPLSKVIHHEGITSGNDLTKGFKKYQQVNRLKFVEKWKSELKNQYSPNPNDIYQFSNRQKGKRILIFDDIPPFPDQSSGALRHYNTVKQLLELGFQITYVHMMGKKFIGEKSQKHLNNFKMLGVEFQWFNYEGWWNIRNEPMVKEVLQELIDGLELKKRKYDLVYIAFWHIGDYFIDLIRKEIPKTPIVIDSVDIHYLRETRRAQILNDSKLLNEAQKTKKNELEVYKKADSIITVTEEDRKALIQDLPNKNIMVISDVHDGCETTNVYSDRKDFLFVGNFNHNPNEDAVFFFIEEIFPIIKAKIPDCKFYIVGNNPTEKILKLASEEVIVTGWVPKIEPYLEKCLVTVVPLRFGAGMKGKVGQSLSHGLPMVSTTIGAEGMDLINEKHSFITDNPKKFAEYAIELYSNEELWNKFSYEGKNLISSKFSSAEMRKRLLYIASFKSREEFKAYNALHFSSPPETSIIILTHNQLKYTRECIESILSNTSNNYELIVVENNSSDGTNKYLNKLQNKQNNIKVILNNENKGFPKAVNQGISKAIGKNIVIANNDIVVTNGWLDRMIEVAESEKEIGIVGPISNLVSGVQLDKNAKYNSIEEMHEYAKSVSANNKFQVEEFPRVAFLCTLIKKEVIDKIGGLDERFSPGNFEDDDFCLRAQLAGYKTMIAKDVFVHHYGSVSFKQDGESKYDERLKINEKIFIDKWGSNPEGIWLKGEKYNKRSVQFPIDVDIFKQSISRAFINIDDEEYDFAIKNLKIVLENFEKSSRVGYENISKEDLINMIANLALTKNELEEAKIYFEKQLSENPNSSQACFGLGEVFNKANMFEESKTMFEWAIVNDENNKLAQIRLDEVNEKLNFPKGHNSVLLEASTEKV